MVIIKVEVLQGRALAVLPPPQTTTATEFRCTGTNTPIACSDLAGSE
jgi:hypothetical protein